MEISLIGETLKFLVLGMSTVFMFLVIMVYVVELQSKIIMRFFPNHPPEILPQERYQTLNKHAQSSPTIAAIVAAIHINKMIKPKE